MGKKAPKLAPWAGPGLIAATWFVWPAVPDSAKISLGLMPDPEAIAEAEATASDATKDEIMASAAQALMPTKEQLRLAERESRGDFSHLEAHWEKFDISSLKFEDDDDDDDDDDEEDEEEEGEEGGDDEDDDDDDDE